MTKFFQFFKQTMRYCFYFLGTLLFFVISYFLYWTPIGNDYSHVSLKPYQEAWKKNGKSPIDYVVSKFQTKDVILLGEPHRRAQDLKFVCKLLPEIRKRAGVNVLGIEFGYASRSQHKVDQLMKKKAFDRELAKQILCDYDFYFLYEEYLELFKTVFEINQRLGKEEKPFQLLLLDPGYKEFLSQKTQQKYQVKLRKDPGMAKKVLKEVEKGEKVLVFCGLHHAFTKFRLPNIIPFISEKDLPARRLGNILYEEIPEKVFCIALHKFAFKKWVLFLWPLYLNNKFMYSFGGVLDKAYALYKTPVGFDATLEPFAQMEDRVSYYSLYKEKNIFSDFVDGYIILNSLAEYTKVKPFSDLNSKDIDYLRKLYPEDKLYQMTEKEFLKFIQRNGLGPVKAYRLIDTWGYHNPVIPTFRALYPFLLFVFGIGFFLKKRKQKKLKNKYLEGSNPENKPQ